MAFSTSSVAAMIGLQFQRLPIAVDEGVIAVSAKRASWEPRRLHPPDNEPHRRGVRLGLDTGCKSSRRHLGAVHPVEWESSPPLVASIRSPGSRWRMVIEADILSRQAATLCGLRCRPVRELSPGPAVAASPSHAGSGRPTGGVGPATRAAGTSAPRRCRRQWPAAGDSRGHRPLALLGQSIGLADGRVQVDGQGRVAWSGPSGPGPGQQLGASRVELTDMPRPEAAQEGGWMAP